jgi:transcription initiation factor TFIIIB Brf1 subunit/transcription initiation factor TFIIB
MRCPLCDNKNTSDYCEDNRRSFYVCECCQLVFVSSDQWLSSEDEKAVYDKHQNTPNDQAYRKFLSRLFIPLLEKLKPGDAGLDFGCGPGPTLSVMFEEQGFPVQLYDIFYNNNPSVLKRHYQFITATEVIEHLQRPGAVVSQLWQLLKPGGTLGVMTKLLINKEAFLSWHYKNDQTHVCFFSRQTFNWLANELDAQLTIVGNDVILLTKPE